MTSTCESLLKPAGAETEIYQDKYTSTRTVVIDALGPDSI